MSRITTEASRVRRILQYMENTGIAFETAYDCFFGLDGVEIDQILSGNQACNCHAHHISLVTKTN